MTADSALVSSWAVDAANAPGGCVAARVGGWVAVDAWVAVAVAAGEASAGGAVALVWSGDAFIPCKRYWPDRSNRDPALMTRW